MTEDNTARLSAPEAIRYATMIVRDVLSSTTEEEDIANVREESLVNLSALLEAHIGERASTAFVEPPGSSAAGDLLQVLATLQTLFVEGNDDANEALANTSVLQHIGWDLYKQLVPLVAMGGEVATHSIALLERVMAVCSPKEMFIVLAEQLEAWDGSLPNASYVAQVLLTHFAKGALYRSILLTDPRSPLQPSREYDPLDGPSSSPRPTLPCRPCSARSRSAWPESGPPRRTSGSRSRRSSGDTGLFPRRRARASNRSSSRRGTLLFIYLFIYCLCFAHTAR